MASRQARVGELLRREIANLLLYEMRDPRLAGATVTSVRISRDLTFAKVFVSILGDHAALMQAVEALDDAVGWIRRRLAPDLGLRRMPELSFEPDESAANALRVDSLLAEAGMLGSSTEAADADEADGTTEADALDDEDDETDAHDAAC